MKPIKKLFFTGLLALSALVSPTVLAADKLPSGTPYEDIGSKIEAFVQKEKQTDAAVETAIFTKDETIYKGHFGYMNKEDGLKADDNAVFEWGSITKTVTWVAVMQQVEAGKIDLKADIRSYLPEGFLKKLRFDKPITMLDLMNHQAGFQEQLPGMQVKNPEDILKLADFLRQEQPIQISEPGTVTSYSNWGTALAGYIVERVSGQTYADYVQAHIFAPLGMTRSSAKADRSDNAFVKEARSRNNSYDAEGKSLGAAYEYDNDEPAGVIASTLADLQTYAQALLRREAGTLFKKKETWDQLFATSSTYGDSDIPRNRHGFWVIQNYAVPVTGHGGGMTGYTSQLLLDLDRGIGMVVLTSQQQELTFTTTMPGLVFGSAEDSPYAPEEKDQLSSAYYLSNLGFREGPVSVLQALLGAFAHQQSPLLQQRLQPLYRTGQLADGRQYIAIQSMDLPAISDGEVWLIYGSLIGAGLSLFYALGQLLVSAVSWLWRKLRKKEAPASQAWHNALAGLSLLTGLTILSFVFQVMRAILDREMYLISQQVWHLWVIAGLSLFLLLGLGYPLVSRLWQKKAAAKLTLGARLHTGLTAAAVLAILWNVYLWDLYQWWLF